MTITIEKINETHIAGFHACLDAVAREGRFLGQTQASPLEAIAAFVRNNIEGNLPQYVALHQQVVVGWCDAIPCWAAGLAHRAELGMGVLAAYRGQGIGTRLLSHTLAHARRLGVRRVDLEVRADNASAIALYTAAGFQPEGRRAMGLFHHGVYHDTLNMGLIFEDLAA
ncbi:GNAT family N-acetyltransferase [Leeia aquatica]|uniref:GNAT family N-acetyltransferase n=1 Tax=Leeia aquatica TaxID=2725557 RepID=A0A847S614_9NEIS|nr:GNAT family N-acetyltransferase [Leeia aquatica]NLR74245.1 GNAT family N-acetyltransferase [Leeia aquatica]